jgi:hypothetical protein
MSGQTPGLRILPCRALRNRRRGSGPRAPSSLPAGPRLRPPQDHPRNSVIAGYKVAWTGLPSGPPLLEALDVGAIDFGAPP